MEPTPSPAIIEGVLNGGRSRDVHPSVPLTPAEVVVDVVACFAVGATVAHVHARRADGTWSADPDWYAETIPAIRDGCQSGLDPAVARFGVRYWTSILTSTLGRAPARP